MVSVYKIDDDDAADDDMKSRGMLSDYTVGAPLTTQHRFLKHLETML